MVQGWGCAVTISLHTWEAGKWIVVVRWDKLDGYGFAARLAGEADYRVRRACYPSEEHAKRAAKRWIKEATV